MQRCKPIGISLPEEFMQKIDVERGDVPRSRYVLRMLEEQYNTLGRKKVEERGSPGHRFHTLQPSEPLTP